MWTQPQDPAVPRPSPLTALVTGGNRGIGQAIARGLVAAGVDVTIGSRDPAAGQAAARDIGCRSVHLDLTELLERLNKERGITVLLITHEIDIAEYGTRLIRFRDGRVVADQPILHRRNAADELAALPPPEPDLIPPPPAEAAHQ